MKGEVNGRKEKGETGKEGWRWRDEGIEGRRDGGMDGDGGRGEG
jgi:hypothetical protein